MFRSLRTIRSIPRIKDIALILGKHGFHQVAGALQAPFSASLRWLLRREPKHSIQQPERLRMALEELGPTFIKFGQLLSTRPDIVPSAYIEELGKLQDEVRPAPFEEIRALMKAGFQAEPETLFARIDPTPLASASIAQVHRATTLEGEEVVVKVRKQGLDRIIEQDLQVLSLLAEFLAGWRGLRLFDPEGVVRLFERSLGRELNFDYERYNLLRIRENLGDDSRLSVPRVYPHLSRKGILTMEYFAGEKLSQFRSKPMELERGRRVGTDVALGILKQMLEDGFYHADPHPGNFVLREDGRLGLIDFGNVGRFTREMKEDLLKLLVALLRRNYRDIGRWVLTRGHSNHDVDEKALAIELMDALDPYYGLTLAEIQVGGLFNALFSLVLRHGISIPAPYVLAGRTFVTLEGVIRLCSPSLELVPAIEPYLAQVLQRRWSPTRILHDIEEDAGAFLSAVRTLPANLSEVLDRAASGRFHVDVDIARLGQLGEKIAEASSRVQFAVLASGLMISSAILLFARDGSGTLQTGLGLTGIGALFLLILKLVVRG